MAMSPTLLPIQQQQQSMSPQMPYPQQSVAAPGYNNGTASGGVASMIKALMDGQNQFRQRQQMAQHVVPNTQPMASGLPGVSVPMTPNAIPGSPGSTSNLPGMPNGVDPTVQALFSPVPGQGG